jgi:hypothetical protein
MRRMKTLAGTLMVMVAVTGAAGSVAFTHPAGAATATWTQLSPTTSPSPRQAATMAYDSNTKQLLLFGGLSATHGLSNDTWVWSGVELATAVSAHEPTRPLGRCDGVRLDDWPTGALRGC